MGAPFGVLLFVVLGSVARAESNDVPDDRVQTPAVREALGQDWLVVTRDRGAESCPDATTLREATSQLLDDDEHAFAVKVVFTRQDGTFTAEISRAHQEGLRKLSDSHYDCAPLASAVATAVALLVDAKPPSPVALPEPMPSQSPSREPGDGPMPKRALAAPLWLGGEVRFGLAHALIHGSQVATGVELFVERARLRGFMHGLSLLPASSDHLSGGLTHSAWALGAGACGRVAGDLTLALSACSGVYLGSITVESEGYFEDDRTRTQWLAIPVELRVSGAFGWRKGLRSGFSLGASALIPTREVSFVVAGAGEAFATPNFGGLLWGALSLASDISRRN